jgi:hypothetical protein
MNIFILTYYHFDYHICTDFLGAFKTPDGARDCVDSLHIKHNVPIVMDNEDDLHYSLIYNKKSHYHVTLYELME